MFNRQRQTPTITAFQYTSAVASPRGKSPVTQLFRKNSLSLKQKPIHQLCIEPDVSRLDVVQDSLVHQTRAILQLMNAQAMPKSSTHSLQVKQPIGRRVSADILEDTFSTTLDTKLYTEPDKKDKARTERSMNKHATEIEETAEYKRWLMRYKSHASTKNLKDNKENKDTNRCTSPKTVNISVKLVNKVCISKVQSKTNLTKPPQKIMKKRSVAIN